MSGASLDCQSFKTVFPKDFLPGCSAQVSLEDFLSFLGGIYFFLETISSSSFINFFIVLESIVRLHLEKKGLRGEPLHV